MAFDPKLRARRERGLFVTAVIFSSIIWAALVVSVVGLLYGIAIGLAILVAHALFLAHVRGNGVRISDRQLPDLYARARAAAEKLGLEAVPEVYVVQAGGVLNAFATKFFSRRFVVLYSELLGECRDQRQLDFVLGHEMGHLAAGHLSWRPFLTPFLLVPWLGTAYLRAREYTADRCGLAAAGDLEQSMRGLVVLAAGGNVARQADLAAFMWQRNETGSFWMAVLELSATHPYLCKRVAALGAISNPRSVPPVGRHPLAWLLAPVLGAASGGPAAAPLMVVAIIGMLMGTVGVYAFNRFKKARITDTKLVIKNIEQALVHFQTDNTDACPKSLSDLFQQKYLTKEPVDAWGQPLAFRCPGEHNTDGADIVSKGEDKQEGTPDDIKSWDL